MNQGVDPVAAAAAHYAVAVRSRRDILQTLFYETKNQGREAGALYSKRLILENRHGDGSFSIGAGDIMPRQELFDAQTEAEATAQDAACALMLLADACIQRLRRAADGVPDTRTIGANTKNGVRLNAAIWALANQARHIDSWVSTTDENLERYEEARTIRALDYDPRNLNVAREFVSLDLPQTYVEFEDMLLQTA